MRRTKLLFFMAFLLFCCISFDAAAGDKKIFVRVLRAYFEGGDGFCWFCPVFAIIFKGLNNLATEVAETLADNFKILVAAGMLVFIVFKVGKMLTQIQAPAAGVFMHELTVPLFKAIIAIALLSYPLEIFGLLVVPFLDLSMVMSTDILKDMIGLKMNIDGSSANPDNGMALITAAQDSGVTVSGCNYSKTLTEADFPDDSAFPLANAQNLICWLETVSNSLGVGMALGATLMLLAFLNRLFYVVPNPAIFLAGAAIICSFFFIFVAFPFRLLDSFVRLAFICALMPLWIVLWVFPQTSGYTKTAWEMFLSACLMFVFLSITVGIILIMFDTALGPNTQKIFNLLIEGKTKEAAQLLDVGGRGLFVIIAFAFLGYKMLNTAAALSVTFSGSDPKLQLNLGVAMAGGAANAFGKPIDAAVKLGKSSKAAAKSFSDYQKSRWK